MILDKRINGVRGKLEHDLMLRNHVDMYNICLDVKKLIVEHALDQRIVILDQVGIRLLGQHDRA